MLRASKTFEVLALLKETEFHSKVAVVIVFLEYKGRKVPVKYT